LVGEVVSVAPPPMTEKENDHVRQQFQAKRHKDDQGTFRPDQQGETQSGTSNQAG
jgi:hypothetical protein